MVQRVAIALGTVRYRWVLVRFGFSDQVRQATPCRSMERLGGAGYAKDRFAKVGLMFGVGLEFWKGRVWFGQLPRVGVRHRLGDFRNAKVRFA